MLLIGGLSYHELVYEKHRSQVSSDGDDDAEGWADVVQIIGWCGVPAALVGIGGGWFMMKKSLEPVSKIATAAAKIDERNLHSRLARTGNGDELDRLTEVFNSMIARLENSFQQIREFTLHASHELKTPLTVMRGELETTLVETQSSDPQRERLLSELDEVLRLTKIVDGLTLLTKADAGQVTLELESVRLDELVRDCFEDAKILAQARDVQVCLGTVEQVSLMGDRHRLRQLLLNLSDNAAKYNVPNGVINLQLRNVDGAAEFCIANSGPGIAPELQQRVFDRFFRGDASHNSSVDGCGLGLSIAQWIVHAHGGTIAVRSVPEPMTTFTVRLPLSVK
ncbi:MAG: Integral rane sensor signal transduction histidine kinase [Verrucomicrobiales bacterium]|nr:Integral rane sensor signal transduction histidine kinase [Verrucomicrobiales bacterium]